LVFVCEKATSIEFDSEMSLSRFLDDSGASTGANHHRYDHTFLNKYEYDFRSMGVIRGSIILGSSARPYMRFSVAPDLDI
jgi:hypothetical protein